jgi:hypothetical protein
MGKAIEFYKFKKDYFGNHDLKGPWEIPCSFSEMVKRFESMDAHVRSISDIMFEKYGGTIPPWSDYSIDFPSDVHGIYFKLSSFLSRELSEVLDAAGLSGHDDQHLELLDALYTYALKDPAYDYGFCLKQ